MNTKLCEFCGKAIPANSKICPYCNKAFNSKVFSFNTQDTASERGRLDVSKYTKNSEQKIAENYFDSNIYSVSQEEIEKRYEKKDVVYDEEERLAQNEQYRHQRDRLPSKPQYKKRNKSKNNNRKPVIIVAVVAVLVIIIIILALSGKDDTPKPAEIITSKTITQTTTTEPTTEETTETSTMPTITFSSSSTDVYGYLNVNFGNVSSDFGDQTSDSTSDSDYGGSNYHYDGMTVSTDSSGLIKKITTDYNSASNKSLYWFTENISYCANQDIVQSAMTNYELTSSDDTSLTYMLDSGSNQYVKFSFDSNKIITGFETYVAQ